MAQAMADASRQKFYNPAIKETETRLTDELARVYRDYCLEVWTEVLNLTGVLAASEWRRAENVYYPPDFREAPKALLAPKIDVAPITIALEQLPITQTSPTPPPLLRLPKGLARLVT